MISFKEAQRLVLAGKPIVGWVQHPNGGLYGPDRASPDDPLYPTWLETKQSEEKNEQA